MERKKKVRSEREINKGNKMEVNKDTRQGRKIEREQKGSRRERERSKESTKERNKERM